MVSAIPSQDVPIVDTLEQLGVLAQQDVHPGRADVDQEEFLPLACGVDRRALGQRAELAQELGHGDSVGGHVVVSW